MKKIAALSQAVFVLGLTVLPGCDWFKTGDTVDNVAMKQKEISDQAMQHAMDDEMVAADTSEVLLSIEGKPIMTVDSFEKEFEEFLESNPQARQMMAFVPNLKGQVFDGLSRHKVIAHHIKKEGIDQKPEYQEQVEKGKKAVTMLVNDQFYKEGLPVSVSETEVRAFYEKQKAENPQLILSVGGVKARGVRFENEDDAKAFQEAAQSAEPGQFESLVVSGDLANQETDFRMVSEYSPGLDAKLKEAILSIDSFPAAKVAKDADGSFWVVYASEKEEKKYHPYEQVKGELEANLKRAKTEEAVEKHLEGLKKQYDIMINKEYLEKEQAEKTAELEAIQEQMRMAMEQGSQEEPTPDGEGPSSDGEPGDMAACIA